MNVHSYKCRLDKLSVLLKLVSDNNRLQILCLLQNGELCVCKILEHLKLSQSLISHHLKDLRDFDLVSDRKEGKWSYYSLTPKGHKIISLILKIKI